MKRLVFLNGHGGKTAVLQIAIREGRMDHGLITALASWFACADLSGCEGAAYDIHAGDSETSVMLAARPDLVDMLT